MPLPEDKFIEFMALLSPDAPKRELECARYLCDATIALFPNYPEAEITYGFEHRMFFGRSDFVVVGQYKSGFGKQQRCAYFWELKAPQCFLFQYDDAQNRVRPTLDLIKAETQLLHYVEEARGSQIFRDVYQVSPENVKMGGIIIGRDNRLWNPDDNRLFQAAAELSSDVRKRLVYDQLKLQVMTWDRIAALLEPNH